MFNLNTTTYGHRSQSASAGKSVQILRQGNAQVRVFACKQRLLDAVLDAVASVDLNISINLEGPESARQPVCPDEHAKHQCFWSSFQLMVSAAQCVVLPHDPSPRDPQRGLVSHCCPELSLKF